MASAGFRFIKIVVFFLIAMTSIHSQALTITVSGASSFAQDITTTTTTTTPASKVIINGGYAMPSACAEQNGTTTCNSCVGNRIEDPNSTTTTPAPCNEASIYDSLQLSIAVESDKADFNTMTVGVASETGYSGKQLQGFSVSTVNGKSYSISTTWSQLMTALSVSLTCSTTTGCGGTKTFYFGPIKDDSFQEMITVTVNYSVVNYTSKAAPLNGFTKALAQMCPPQTYEPLVSKYTSTGLCYFEMFPGDEKAYITNLINGWKASPVDPDTQLTYSSLVMYNVEKTGSATSLATLSSIQNNSPKTEITITGTDGDPLGSYKVLNLENSTTDTVRTYCFLPAIKDQTGNIIYFLDINKLMSLEQFLPEDIDRMCASPSEVVGVLSDKDCFIATIAFGARNHPFLDVLREFRNKYLHPYSWGQKFIKFYYKNGPDWAKEIGQHSWAKSLVKVALVPIVGIVYLILNPLWLVVVMASATVMLLVFSRPRLRKRGQI